MKRTQVKEERPKIPVIDLEVASKFLTPLELEVYKLLLKREGIKVD